MECKSCLQTTNIGASGYSHAAGVGGGGNMGVGGGDMKNVTLLAKKSFGPVIFPLRSPPLPHVNSSIGMYYLYFFHGL